jgi:Pregnancy-associated plasma protein-A/GEVED domain/Secretion system C-terminal sorting domain
LFLENTNLFLLTTKSKQMKQLTSFLNRTACRNAMLSRTAMQAPLSWVVAAFIILLSTNLSAQDIRPSCGFDHAHEEAMALDPDFAARVAAYDRAWAENAHLQGAKSMTNTIYTIPVVFHIMNVGEAVGTGSNLSAARIDATMAYLNAVFAKSASLSPTRGGANIEIQFALATRAPDCSVTTGITRHNFSGNATYVANGVKRQTTNGIPDTDVKNTIQWDPTAYMNVWVVNKVDGWNGLVTGSGVVGWATFPGGTPTVDGLMMMAAFTNTNEPTLSHEVGHYLNLYHTFQAPSGVCPDATNSDFVADTEAHVLRGDFACGPTLTNSCNANALYNVVETVAGTPLTVLNNYMNYASQSCTVMFSEGQKTRMRAVLETQRPGLLSSSAFQSASSAPIAACSVTAPSGGLGTGNFFGIARTVLNTIDVVSSSSLADGNNYKDYTCTHSTAMTIGVPYTASVTSYYTNGHRIKMWIDYNNDGDFLDAGENVLGGTSTSANTYTVSGTVTPPATAVVNTPLRMRVKADYTGWVSLAAMTPCDFVGGNPTNGNGQVEDYTITILSPYISSAYTDITTCPTVTLANETTAGKTNDVATWACAGTKAGNDIAYRITLPTGATKLLVNVSNLSAPVDVLWLNTSNLPAGCVTTTPLTTDTPCQLEYTVPSGGTYYLVIDHSNGSDVTYDIKFGAVTGTATIPAVSDTRGTWALEPSVCEPTMFKKATKVIYNGVAQPFPLTLSPLNSTGVLCTKVFLQNTTGQEGLKTASFSYAADLTALSPTTATMAGVYNTGTWTAVQTGQVITWTFADAALTGRGDWTGAPTACLAYNFCVNITPVSNNPVGTEVIGTFTGDGEGSPAPAVTVNTGCCAAVAPGCCPMFSGSGVRTPSVLMIDYNDPAPLPIKLLAFNGHLTQQKTVALAWQTATEQNSNRFEIERSIEGKTFEYIGKTNAAGNSNTVLKYDFEDTKPQIGNLYYRLKMIDNDGSFEYSNIVNIILNGNIGKWLVYPNPASDMITLESNDAATAKLYNIQGQVLDIITIQKGSNTISVAHLAQGVYYIKEVAGGKTVKIIKN